MAGDVEKKEEGGAGTAARGSSVRGRGPPPAGHLRGRRGRHPGPRVLRGGARRGLGGRQLLRRAQAARGHPVRRGVGAGGSRFLALEKPVPFRRGAGRRTGDRGGLPPLRPGGGGALGAPVPPPAALPRCPARRGAVRAPPSDRREPGPGAAERFPGRGVHRGRRDQRRRFLPPGEELLAAVSAADPRQPRGDRRVRREPGLPGLHPGAVRSRLPGGSPPRTRTAASRRGVCRRRRQRRRADDQPEPDFVFRLRRGRGPSVDRPVWPAAAPLALLVVFAAAIVLAYRPMRVRAAEAVWAMKQGDWDHVVTYRLGAWAAAVEMARDRPWLGFGPGTD